MLFSEQIARAGALLIEHRNPYDGGWGLRLTAHIQAVSSLVNTMEALYVLNRAQLQLNDVDRTVEFIRTGIKTHPDTRGDNLRYYVYGVLGLLECGIGLDDDLIQETATRIAQRAITNTGWAEHSEDKDARAWQTYLALSTLAAVWGPRYVAERYQGIIANLVSIGVDNQGCWGWALPHFREASLVTTAYISQLLSTVVPTEPLIQVAHQSIVNMLDANISKNEWLETEVIAGAFWHHYSFCWALRALHQEAKRIDAFTLRTTSKVLEKIASSFDGAGFQEVNGAEPTVRSIYNCVAAIVSTIASFDPHFYLEMTSGLE